jgi:hypothetical protein
MKVTNFRKDQLIFLLFKIGIFLTFFGHEYEAFNVNKIWIHYLEDIGFSKEQASTVFVLLKEDQAEQLPHNILFNI